MGIIRAAVNAVHGSLADQWLETVEPYEMGEHTVFTEGILVRKGQNKKGSQTISNGSVIHVYDIRRCTKEKLNKVNIHVCIYRINILAHLFKSNFFVPVHFFRYCIQGNKTNW